LIFIAQNVIGTRRKKMNTAAVEAMGGDVLTKIRLRRGIDYHTIPVARQLG